MNYEMPDKVFRLSDRWTSCCQYHIVFLTYCNREFLDDACIGILEDVLQEEELLSGVQVKASTFSSNRVHLIVDCPVEVNITDYISRVKRKSAHELYARIPGLTSRTAAIWDGSTMLRTVGNLSEDDVNCYVCARRAAKKTRSQKSRKEEVLCTGF